MDIKCPLAPHHPTPALCCSTRALALSGARQLCPDPGPAGSGSMRSPQRLRGGLPVVHTRRPLLRGACSALVSGGCLSAHLSPAARLSPVCLVSSVQTRQLSGAEVSPVSWPALYPGWCQLSAHPGSCEKRLQLRELGGFSQGTPNGAQTLPGALAEREAGPAVRRALGSQGPRRMLE